MKKDKTEDVLKVIIRGKEINADRIIALHLYPGNSYVVYNDDEFVTHFEHWRDDDDHIIIDKFLNKKNN